MIPRVAPEVVKLQQMQQMPQIPTAQVCWLVKHDENHMNFMGWMMLDVYLNGGCLRGMVITMF